MITFFSLFPRVLLVKEENKDQQVHLVSRYVVVSLLLHFVPV